MATEVLSDQESTDLNVDMLVITVLLNGSKNDNIHAGYERVEMEGYVHRSKGI